jgi:hypothetical protein
MATTVTADIVFFMAIALARSADVSSA